ncbi:MAG: hypothetical protein QOH61_179 [Chloroflexota bacterium]|jgi:hypothetical protein|nr:hypothetical protein [Chloroflexota bacterium]
MGGARQAARRFTLVANRIVERLLPPDVLWFLYWPIAAMRGVKEARSATDLRIPVSHLPPSPTDPPPSFRARWRFYFDLNSGRPLHSWGDRLGSPRWRKRYVVDGFDGFVALAKERGIISIGFHTVATRNGPAWMRTLGVQAASVALDPEWFSPHMLARTRLGQPGAAVTALPTGMPRELLRYLGPGSTLGIGADHPLGRTVTVPWGGGSMRVAVGSFRLAAMSGVAVVPIIFMSTRRWRFQIHVGSPVPDALIQAGDFTAAAQHVVDELLPYAASSPHQAGPTFVYAMLGEPARTATPEPAAARQAAQAQVTR